VGTVPLRNPQKKRDGGNAGCCKQRFAPWGGDREEGGRATDVGQREKTAGKQRRCILSVDAPLLRKAA